LRAQEEWHCRQHAAQPSFHPENHGLPRRRRRGIIYPSAHRGGHSIRPLIFLETLPILTHPQTSPEAPFGSPQNPWRRPDGSVIACEEKLKVMRENLAELRQVALDALEDAVLMGCDEAQVKKAFLDEIAALTSGYPAAE
jgi:hypothetical protein